MKAEEPLPGQLDMFNLDIWCGRMSQAALVQETPKEQTFKPFYKKSAKLSAKTVPLFLSLKRDGTTQETSMAWETMELPLAFLGDSMIVNTGAFPKDEEEYVSLLTSGELQQAKYCLNCGEKPNKMIQSKLSDILEMNPNPKYNLSETACRGILRRATERGKELPELLRTTLERQSLSKNEQVNQGGVKESSFNENEQELSLPLTTNQSSIQDNSVCYGFEPGAAQRMNPESRFSEETSPTLRANMGDNQAAVVYGMSPYDSNAMKSSNPHSGVYETDTTKTLDLNGGNPACNQGGMMVVQSYGLDPHNVSVSEEKTMTMLQGKNDNHNVPCVYGIDRASFNQGKNAKYDFAVEEEIAQPLVARGPGGGNDTVGALCARDYKGVGNQYVDEGKCIIQPLDE